MKRISHFDLTGKSQGELGALFRAAVAGLAKAQAESRIAASNIAVIVTFTR